MSFARWIRMPCMLGAVAMLCACQHGIPAVQPAIGEQTPTQFHVAEVAPLEIAVTVDPIVNLDPQTGIVTIKGTVTSNKHAFVNFYSGFDQQRARLKIHFGGFTSLEVPAGTSTWALEGTTLGTFVPRPGEATGFVSADAYSPEDSESASVFLDGLTVVVSPRK